MGYGGPTLHLYGCMGYASRVGCWALKYPPSGRLISDISDQDISGRVELQPFYDRNIELFPLRPAGRRATTNTSLCLWRKNLTAPETVSNPNGYALIANKFFLGLAE